MKNFILILLLLISFQTIAQTNSRHVHVKSHTNSNGTYVPEHHRTAPNNTNRDNFSTKGNENPYTGQSGWIAPDNNTLYSPPTNGNTTTPRYFNSNSSTSDAFSRTNQFFSQNTFTPNLPEYKTKRQIPVRESFGDNSTIIDYLPANTIIKAGSTMISVTNIYWDNKQGWVKSSDIQFFRAAEKQTSYSENSFFSKESITKDMPYYKTKREVALRASFGDNSTIIDYIPINTMIRVGSSMIDDVHVYWDDKDGYVKKTALQFVSASDKSSSNSYNLSTSYNFSNQDTELQESTCTTHRESNVRSNHSTKASLIDKIEAGTEMEILERSGEWLKVSYKKDFYNQLGWIHESNVNIY